MISYNVPTIGKEEERAALRVLRSRWLTEGVEVEKFETECCNFLGAKQGRAAAFSSGSAALYVALRVLDIGKGDAVMIPSYACSAVLDAIFLAGAVPVLVDIGEEDLNISIAATKRNMTRKVKAVVATHTYGMPADMAGLGRLGIPIIEDAAQGIGAQFHGRAAGTLGDIAVFSFGATKLLTTGNGGMIYSANTRWVASAKAFRAYEQPRGYRERFNFQLSDLQAAIGREQLKKFPSFLRRRKRVAQRYKKAFPAERVWPQRIPQREPNWYRFFIHAEDTALLRKRLKRAGVDTRVPAQSMEPLHRRLGLPARDFPVADRLPSALLSLPIHPSLKDAEVARIIAVVTKYM